MPINEELRDLLLKRSHYIHRFENGTANDIVEHYSRAKPEIMSKISKLEDYGSGYTLQYRLDRLNNQFREIDVIVKNATDDAINGLSYELNEFANTEKDYYENLLQDRLKPLNINLTRIPFEHVNEIINTPIGGALYSERMIKRYNDTVFLMKQELTQSIIQGEDMAKASRRLVGVGKKIGGKVGAEIQKQATVIARTEIQRVSNSVSKRIYDENTDVLKGVEFVATLDDRTCLLPESIVRTEDGWKEIKDISIGDKVLTHTGEFKPVIDKFSQQKTKYLKIKLSNGKTLKITPDHKVLVNGNWIEISKLMIGDFIDGI